MSKTGTRQLQPIDIPDNVKPLLTRGTKAYRLGGCQILVSQNDDGWHLSISRPTRLPSWEDVAEARYQLVPDEVTMAMILPPTDEYVNVHEYCFHLHQIKGERE